MRKVIVYMLGILLAISFVAARGEIQVNAYTPGEMYTAQYGVWRTASDGFDKNDIKSKAGDSLYFHDAVSGDYSKMMRPLPKTLTEVKQFQLVFKGDPNGVVFLNWNTGQLSSNYKHKIDCGTGKVYDMTKKNYMFLWVPPTGEKQCTIMLSMT